MEALGMMNPEFWRGRRVFITGHTGFKGSWLAQWLAILGAELRGYSLSPPTDPSLFAALGLEREMDHLVGDIRDAEALSRAVRDFRPEIVFHLAAQPLVRLSYKEPRLTYETNVMGTLNLYEAVRASEGVRAIVSITTDKCYENREWVWGYRESDPMGGYDPYSSSKGCAELLSAAYRRSFFDPQEYGISHRIALATARAGNVIGGGDWAPDRLLPDCIRYLARGEKIVIRNPGSTRPWQHVLEPLSGYLLLAERMFRDGTAFGEGWNFGPGDEGVMNVERVVKSVIASWGAGSYEVASDSGPHEARFLKLDVSKARSLLGWSPRYSADQAIELAIEVYRRFVRRESDVKKSVISQIESYSRR